ncbi:MAG: hypothetical protein GX979_07785 [Firmicutes bacterium]|nr:hypothetical protein [Bacillota bacterium]
MRGTIGLLLYVAVMILSSLLRKAAADRARQGRPSIDGHDLFDVTRADGFPETLPQEGILVEEMSEELHGEDGLHLAIIENLREFQNQRMEDSEGDDWEDWDDSDDDEDGGWRQMPQESEPGLDETMKPLGSQWADAIVLSEIIREPRAKRAWPSR